MDVSLGQKKLQQPLCDHWNPFDGLSLFCNGSVVELGHWRRALRICLLLVGLVCYRVFRGTFMKKMILVFLLASSTAFAGEMNFTVKGMSCESCAKSLKKSFSTRTEIEKVEISVEKKSVHLVTKEGSALTQKDVEALVKDAGMLVDKFDSKPVAAAK